MKMEEEGALGGITQSPSSGRGTETRGPTRPEAGDVL